MAHHNDQEYRPAEGKTVSLSAELTVEDAKRLQAAFARGELQRFGIISISSENVLPSQGGQTQIEENAGKAVRKQGLDDGRGR